MIMIIRLEAAYNSKFLRDFYDFYVFNFSFNFKESVTF